MGKGTAGMITDQQRAELKARIDAISTAHTDFQRKAARAAKSFVTSDLVEAHRAGPIAGELRRALFEWIDKEL